MGSVTHADVPICSLQPEGRYGPYLVIGVVYIVTQRDPGRSQHLDRRDDDRLACVRRDSDRLIGSEVLEQEGV